MSWSFSAIGKPMAVLALARKQLGAIKCAEPEETLKGKVLNQIECSLLAMPESSAVRIEASGSQSPAYAPNESGQHVAVAGKFTNNLSLKIEPIWGFAE